MIHDVAEHVKWKKVKVIYIKMEWTDIVGNEHKYETSDMERALDMIGLLNGTITEEDLKP